MSWVEPIGYVRLLKGVALEPGYENTIYFESRQDQYNYFFHHDGISFNNLTYTRYNRGIIRVSRNIKDCYKINYMMYCNDVPSTSSYSSLQKWFYCFVTEVNYIAEEVTEIVFQPDLLQTWMTEYELGSCYIDRQHTVTDAVGEWIEDEGFDVGPLMYEEIQPIRYADWSVVVATNFEASYNAVDMTWSWDFNVGGQIKSGVYGAVNYIYFNYIVNIDSAGNVTYNQANLALLNDFFSELKGLNYDYTDRIISIFMMPTSMALSFALNDPMNPYKASYNIEKQVPTANHPSSHQWYYGKNNNIAVKNFKLYTYPFTGLIMTNETNAISTLPYEYFNKTNDPDNCAFTVCSALSANPECWIYPMYYRGLYENFNEKMDFGGFPICSWSSDSYKVWLAQTAIGFGEMVLNDMAAASRYELSKISSTRLADKANQTRVKYTMSNWGNKQFRNLAGNAQADLYRRESNAVQTLGLIDFAGEIAGNMGDFLNTAGNTYFPFSPNQSNVLAMGMNLKNFRFFNFKPTKNYIERLDGYFNRYGYAIKKMQVPNRKARTRWTYLKTIGLNFTKCDMPGDIAEEIRAIYEAGVTWWYANFTISGTTGLTIDNNAPGTYDAADNGFWGTRWQAPVGGV